MIVTLHTVRFKKPVAKPPKSENGEAECSITDDSDTRQVMQLTGEAEHQSELSKVHGGHYNIASLLETDDDMRHIMQSIENEGAAHGETDVYQSKLDLNFVCTNIQFFWYR